MEEAKNILRRRYEERGFVVKQIRRSGNQLNVCFGLKEDGRGAGPGGLESVLCNWPTRDAGIQEELVLPPRGRRRRTRRSILKGQKH